VNNEPRVVIIGHIVDGTFRTSGIKNGTSPEEPAATADRFMEEIKI
jgi:hypothetical protein